MRNNISDFELGNPIYKGATVTIYTVSGGVKTTTRATLYKDLTSSDTLLNPQQLDSKGSFQQPVYVDVPVVITISGLTIPDHDTGIIQVSLASSAGDIHAAPSKTIPVDADEFGIWDSTTTLLKRLSWANLSQYLKFAPAGTGAVATTVQSKLREFVSVKDFGAVGDGVTDDTAAIQAALTYAGTIKSTVIVPSGQYLITNTLTIPTKVSLIGVNNGWINGSFAYLGGSVFLKNTNNHCISMTGSGTNNDIGGTIQSICVINGVGYTTGSGIFIDGISEAIVRDCIVSRIGGTASAFQFGFTNIANFTTYVTATNCYSNTTGTGTAFACNGKWLRLNQCISDGGAYGFYLTSVNESMFTDFHCESVSNSGIYATGSGRNKWIKGYVNISPSGIYGIYHANVSGTYFNQYDCVHIIATNTAGQYAFYNAGTNNVFNKLINSVVESFDTGYQDAGANNSVIETVFYNCKFPMVMGGNYSTLTGNATQNTVAAGGTWAINHTSGTIGNWTGNYLDGSNANGVINPGVTGVIGNFSGIKARNNTGFVSRGYGQTGNITSGSTITHGLAGTPTPAISLTCYTGGVTSQISISALGATTFTVGWTGTANVQIGWSANLICDN